MLNISEKLYVVSSHGGLTENQITQQMHFSNLLLQSMVVAFYVMEIIIVHKAFDGKAIFSKLKDGKILLFILIPVNFVFSYLMHKYGYPLFSWGRMGLLIAFSIIIYAILKYRLIDLTELLFRLLVYLFLSAVFFAIWVIFIFSTTFENTPILLSILYGLLIVALFNPLHMVVQRYAQKLVFPKRINYQKTLMDMSMKVVSVLDYQKLIEIINDTIVNIVGASNFALLLHDQESDIYTKRDIELLKILSNHIMIAIDNARLYELAIRDGLTQLYISRFFHQRIVEEILNSIRWCRHLSVLMIDIDYFKTINDTYGHQAGDQILKEFAHIISSEVRDIDIPARYGGEEFSIILPETDNDQAILIAERIRKRIENTTFHKGIKCTASIGIASINGKKIFDSSDKWKKHTRMYIRKKAEKLGIRLIEKADTALYTAKRTGRNKCINGGFINNLR